MPFMGLRPALRALWSAVFLVSSVGAAQATNEVWVFLTKKHDSKFRDRTFKFTGSNMADPGPFEIKTTNGVGRSKARIGARKGKATFTEAPVDGMQLDTVSCHEAGDDGVPRETEVEATVDDAANGIFSFTVGDKRVGVACTITNVAAPKVPPKLILVKQIIAPPLDAPLVERGIATFEVNVTGAGTGKRVLTPVAPDSKSAPSTPIFLTGTGPLTIAETVQPGFELISASCRIGGSLSESKSYIPNNGSFVVPEEDLKKIPSGGTIECTLGNAERRLPPTLTLVKKIGERTGVERRNGTFPFDVSGAGQGTPRLTTKGADFESDRSEKITLNGSGAVTVTEREVDGFEMTGAVCMVDGGSGPIVLPIANRAFSLSASLIADIPSGGNLNCEVTNTPLVRPILTLIKTTKRFPGDFKFTGSGSTNFRWSASVVRPDVPAKSTPFAVNPGTLTITEDETQDFRLEDIDCSATAKPQKDLSRRRVTLTLDYAQKVTCTFRNVKTTASLVLKKVTEGGDGNFSFAVTGTPGTSIATSGGAGTAPTLTVAADQELTITETKLPENFAIKSFSCDNGAKSTTTTIKTKVPPGETVTCTATNVKTTGTIVVNKVAIGGNGTFTFVGSGATAFNRPVTTSGGKGTFKLDVNTGALRITETNLPKGFTLEKIACNGGSPKNDLANRRVDLDVNSGAEITCTFTNRNVGGPTTTIIRNFLNRRAEHLTGDTGRPRLIERRRSFAAPSLKDTLGLHGGGSLKDGQAGYRTSLGRAFGDRTAAKAARYGLNPGDYGVEAGSSRHRSGLDIWSEGRLNYFETDGANGTSGHFGVVRVGADYLLTPSFLVGFLAQYDRLSEDGAGYSISGHGFMVGPYVEYEVSKGLYFDAKALWGTSTNDVSPFDTYTDEFSTTRWLLAARLTGSWSYATSHQSAWHFSPRAEIAYFSEESETYTDSNNVRIDGQRVNLGRVKVGPEISYRYTTREGTRIEPRVSAKGLWAFGSGTARNLDPAFSSSVSERPVDDFQMQFGGGLVIEDPSGVRLDIEGSYTGLAGNDTRSAGGKVNVTIPLQKGN